MANVIVYSENANLAAELVTAAKVIDSSICAVSINNADLASSIASLGVDVCAIDNTDLDIGDTAAVAQALAQVAEQQGTKNVVLASNRRGKELAGRLAQILGVGCLTDLGGLEQKDGAVVATRNGLGGATVMETSVTTDGGVYAIAGKSFLPAEQGAAGSVNAVEVQVTPRVKVVEHKEKSVESVDIAAADVLVAVGMGLEDESQVAQATDVAHALHGEVSCSKPVATDRKWLSEERIVGISGKQCKPDLAMTIGVSGQVQFMVGVRDAKTIVAVNNDENAPIFQFADYGLVADLNEVLPELHNALA